ncbi:MAG: hypothetical protein J5767_12250, partial [Paludibacteraceae bacterium]|nr:hypothetical protein [Paludibacteraceae bacterium]
MTIKLSTLLQGFTFVRLHISHITALYSFFLLCLLPWLFTTADEGCLTGPPDSVPADGPTIISYMPYTAHHHR